MSLSSKIKLKLKILCKALTLVLALLALPSIVKDVQAQRRVDVTPTSTGCYRQPIQPLSIIPPLHSDMSLDCLLGYIYFDSLCRSLQSTHQLDSLLAQIHSWDTLRVFMRFQYRMAEYDADLFNEFLNAASSIDPSFNLPPGLIKLHFWRRMNKVLGANNKFNYLTEVPVILHVKVEAVEISYDSNCTYPVAPQPRKCVRAFVLDTIKGSHFRQGDPVAMSPELKQQQLPQSAESWINIAYFPVSPKSYSRGDILPTTPADSGTFPPFVCDSCYGNSALELGKEYVVFLEDGFLDYNGHASFYEYTPYNTYNDEGGIFSIDSAGNVLSPDNYFGYGGSVALSSFETLLRADIHSIVMH
jgi:hypothetical protein